MKGSGAAGCWTGRTAAMGRRAASGGPRDSGFPTACSEEDGVLIVRDIMASTYRLRSVAWTRKFYEHGSLAATAGVSAYREMTANPRVADIG